MSGQKEVARIDLWAQNPQGRVEPVIATISQPTERLPECFKCDIVVRLPTPVGTVTDYIETGDSFTSLALAVDCVRQYLRDAPTLYGWELFYDDPRITSEPLAIPEDFF